jgi:TPR repeat protein
MSTRAFELADRLEERRRFRDAFRVLLSAARGGDASVFINLGHAYDMGRGIRQSKRKALYWYRKALIAEERIAIHNIGTLYRDRGRTVRAARCFRRAITLGDTGSNLELGQLLLAGLGQPSDALACFRDVGDEASEATTEAAKTWAAVAEGILAERR